MQVEYLRAFPKHAPSQVYSVASSICFNQSFNSAFSPGSFQPHVSLIGKEFPLPPLTQTSISFLEISAIFKTWVQTY